MTAAETIQIDIEKLIYGGEGLSRVNGRVVLTPFVLPGETVQIAPDRGKPDLLRAKLLDVVKPAPERVEPPCPYFGPCGGCHYQHADYAFQLEQKVAILKEVLQRIGKLDISLPVETVSGPAWNYRNRSQFHIEGGKIGYLEAASHRLVDVAACPISSPRLNETLAIVREMMKDDRFPNFLRTVELFTGEQSVQVNVMEASRPLARRFFDWCAEKIPGYIDGPLEYPAAGDLFRVGHKSFFQVNRFLIDDLVKTALEGLSGDSALDLYAGVGLFTLSLARQFRQVTAVETSAGALADLQFNAQRAALSVNAVHRSTDLYLEALNATPELVLADPPRAGLGRTAVRHLLRLRPKCLVIVSCDPATLARDLHELAAGGYRIDRLTMVDLFPQTFHLETVVRLTL